MKGCLKLTDKNFQVEVLDSNLPVFVDFWASWCPPCKMVEPVIDELADHFDGVIKIGKLNVDQNPEIRSKFEIASVPTFVLFKNKQILSRVIGAHSKNQLLQIIKDQLSIEIPE